MALLQYSFYSQSLYMETAVNVALPFYKYGDARSKFEDGGRFPAVYLLHGMGDDHTSWVRYAAIEQLAISSGVTVVMPQGHNSFYCNNRRAKYAEYIGVELPAHMETLLPLSRKRDERFIAGISMGGYGAFRTALANPGTFGRAASLSGALDVELLLGHERGATLLGSVFGEAGSVAGTENDLYHLIANLVRGGADIPRLFACCGTDDQLVELNNYFCAKAAKLGLDIDYRTGQGLHDWQFWTRWLPVAFDWLLDRD